MTSRAGDRAATTPRRRRVHDDPDAIPLVSRRELVCTAVVEVVVLGAYVNRDQPYHWFAHFLVGGTGALSLMTAVVLVGRPGRHIGVAVLAGHAIAALPDVLFMFGVVHAGWMDLFLGHISIHNAPGGLWLLYAAFVSALACYLLALARMCPSDAADHRR